MSGSAPPEDACGTSCSQARHAFLFPPFSTVCASGCNLPSSCWGEAGLTARRGAADGNRALRSRAHTSARLMAWCHRCETCASRVRARVKRPATGPPASPARGAHPQVCCERNLCTAACSRRAIAGTRRTVPAPSARRPSLLACPRARPAPWCHRTTAKERVRLQSLTARTRKSMDAGMRARWACCYRLPHAHAYLEGVVRHPFRR